LRGWKNECLVITADKAVQSHFFSGERKSAMNAKDFGPIESDYAFFMSHATEAENDAADFASSLSGFAPEKVAVRMLDFGCGSGEFTERLLSKLKWPANTLELTLVEPVAHQLAEAARRLTRFTDQPIVTGEVLPDSAGFDLILSNHVLYYVEDLDRTLRQLTAALAPNRMLQLAIAGWDNALMELWTVGFALLGQKVPYHAAEDVESGLSQLGVPFQKHVCPYRLRFADLRENRLRILRFLFADYLQQLPIERMLAAFDQYVAGDHVDIATHSYHIAVARVPVESSGT
jgi:trans-aconitate 2-methyltransferase